MSVHLYGFLSPVIFHPTITLTHLLDKLYQSTLYQPEYLDSDRISIRKLFSALIALIPPVYYAYP